jgi:hypothetical protein
VGDILHEFSRKLDVRDDPRPREAYANRLNKGLTATEEDPLAAACTIEAQKPDPAKQWAENP